jgi:hypothetical protein
LYLGRRKDEVTSCDLRKKMEIQTAGKKNFTSTDPEIEIIKIVYNNIKDT